MLNALCLFLGLTLALVVFVEAFEVMLLPRRIRRRMRMVRYLFASTWLVWSWIADRLRPSPTRDSFLSLFGPLSLLMLLSSWVGGLIAGFGLLQWTLRSSPDGASTLANYMFLSASTFFTLETGGPQSLSEVSKVIAIIEAGSGFAFLALVIGYLPVLYQLFSRRETYVIMLDARAGSPPSATILLARHADGESVVALLQLLHEWEQWSAELTESHLSYPMLSYYRSQHDNQSWLAALAAIMDTCALIMVGIKDFPTLQARMTFSTARLAIVELCRVLNLKPQVYGDTRLTSEDYAQMRVELCAAGLELAEDNAAEHRLRDFRATYEPFLNTLADYLLLNLPAWLPPKDTLDNWQNSPRGRSAKRLVEAAPVKLE
jgi:hypothetical protein